MNNKVLLGCIIAFSFLVFFSVMRGCMPKEEVAPKMVVTGVPTGQLPKLSQNSMYLTNRKTARQAPDFGFQEADPDTLEEVETGKEEFLGD